jgi:hypothetical protein
MARKTKSDKVNSRDMDKQLASESGGCDVARMMTELSSGKMTMRVHPPALPVSKPVSQQGE